MITGDIGEKADQSAATIIFGTVWKMDRTRMNVRRRLDRMVYLDLESRRLMNVIHYQTLF